MIKCLIQSVNQRITMNHWINKSKNHSVNQTTNESVNQRTNESTSQPVRDSMNQWTNLSQWVSESMSQSILNQWTNESITEPWVSEFSKLSLTGLYCNWLSDFDNELLFGMFCSCFIKKQDRSSVQTRYCFFFLEEHIKKIVALPQEKNTRTLFIYIYICKTILRSNIAFFLQVGVGKLGILM